LIEQDLEDQMILFERGLTQATRIRDLKREQARLQGILGELIARKAQAEGLITEIEIETVKISSTRHETAISQLRDQHYREMELKEQRRALKQQLARLDIKAPVSGIVYGLQVFALRAVIRAAEPLLYLVPQDRPLVIAAQVAPMYIDQLFIGQTVFLRFSALDQNNTPELLGLVAQISADTFQNDSAKGAYYRVEITLAQGETARLPEGATLQPGMPVETYIKIGDRSPLAYLIKPLSNYFVKAFRER
jgi:HlyD family type I secretion membrane fusion protein